jgi:Pyroglutamyl peptidase
LKNKPRHLTLSGSATDMDVPLPSLPDGKHVDVPCHLVSYRSTSVDYIPLCGLTCVQTKLPVVELTRSLRKMGYDVAPSDDAGRFVCNYVYYHSLRFSEQNRILSLFVHVPLFLTIDEEVQMQFAGSLLDVLASILH